MYYNTPPEDIKSSNDDDIKESLIRALEDVKNGRVRPIHELWDRIDPTPSITNNTIGVTDMVIQLTLEGQEGEDTITSPHSIDPKNPYNVDPQLLKEVMDTINNLYADTCTQLGIDPNNLKEANTANLKRILCILKHSMKELGNNYPCNATE